MGAPRFQVAGGREALPSNSRAFGGITTDMPEHARTHLAPYPALAPDPARLEQALSQLARLVDVDSTSGREAPAVPVIMAIAAELGLPAQIMAAAPGRDNVYVGAPAPAILLCTHYDTVPPHLPARRDATALWGRGACDAKGVAVAMLHGLVLAARAAPTLPAGCLLVCGEETDHIGAKAAVASELWRPRHVILGEPCGMAPAIGQKGLLKIAVSATGQSGHSAYPELGTSATHRLITGLNALLNAALPADKALGATTVNVGEIHGGLAANVIAPAAEALVLIRCAAPVDSILAAVKDILGPDLVVSERSRSEPIDFDTLGSTAPGAAVPFNTDASILAALGVPVALMGPGDMRCAHGEREHLTHVDLAEGIERYAEAIVRLS